MFFYVFILDAIFCDTISFIFQDNVGLVKSSLSIHCGPFIISTRVAIVVEENLCCVNFVQENYRHNTGSFPFFLVFTTRHSLFSQI